MGQARGGKHADVVYKFEDNGFDSTPADTVFKGFGGNATLDTFEGSHQAVRVFNADRNAAEIIGQVFDGAWSVTFDLGAAPPWWLQAVYGPPTQTEITTGLYEYTYALDNGNDPQALRLYLPTDGFSEYEYLPGCVIASVTVDQSQGESPECTVSGAYAREPQRDSTETISVPAFDKSTFSNRNGDLEIGGDRLAKSQTQNVELQTGTELIGEIGTEHMVDFVPRTFEPSVTADKIVATDQTVDPLQRFKDAASVALLQTWTNGASGTDEYAVSLDFSGSYPGDWSESGRNDPEADLTEELSEMALDCEARVTIDQDGVPT